MQECFPKKLHFLGPFMRDEIPFKHYIACPVYTVPKNDQYDRLIHDLSCDGHAMATNTHIDTNEFDIKLPRLRGIMEIITELKNKSEQVWLWSEDVSEAFHHIKLNVTSRPWMMFRIGDRFYIRTQRRRVRRRTEFKLSRRKRA